MVVVVLLAVPRSYDGVIFGSRIFYTSVIVAVHEGRIKCKMQPNE